MPRDSQGNTNPLPGTIVATGDTILPSQHNPMVNDVYAMMTQSLSRDGQGGMRAPLAMNGFPVRNVGAATQPNDAVTLSQFQSGMPIGSVIDYAGSLNVPLGWTLCFGQAIEVSAHPDFVDACYVGNALNSTAGFGYRTTSNVDPSNNRSTSGQYIVLPDIRGRVIAGRDNMGGADVQRLEIMGAARNLIGGDGGSDRHTLNINQIPSHSHSVNDPGHNHLNGASSIISPGVTYVGSGSNPFFNGNIVTGSSLTNISVNNNGGGQSHNNVQPTIIFNKIIKVLY